MRHIQAVKELLSSSKKIIITMHANPDGDAMGSSLALQLYLINKGHEVNTISPTAYADFLKWMPGNEQITVFARNEATAQKLVEEADVIFCLDFSSLNRLANLEKFVANATAKKIVIDHHIDPDNFPDFLFSNIQASSTCELVYDFIKALDNNDPITKEIADCIYTGILTDTGAFQYPITSSKVHRIAASLFDKGIDHTAIYQKMYNSFSESRLRLFGYCLTEKLRIYPEYKAAMISLTRDELKRFNVKTGDTEGLVNFPLKMEDINFATLIIDRTERIKLSFRTKGSFDVNQFARKYFDGGGHKNAAGGQSTESLDSVLEKFEKVLLNYKDELHY